MTIKNLFMLCIVMSISITPSTTHARSIHVFGDSHALYAFSDKGTPSHHLRIGAQRYPLHVHWLGPRTMHGFGARGTKLLDITTYDVHENDCVVFVFGEIDVRCHIGRLRDQTDRSEDEIIATLVNAYLKSILLNRSFYHHLTCIIMEIVPPADWCYNPEFPFYGSLADRIHITQKLNSALARAAQQAGISILQVYHLLSTPEGYLNKELSDNCVHVGYGHNYLIKQELVKLIMPLLQ